MPRSNETNDCAPRDYQPHTSEQSKLRETARRIAANLTDDQKANLIRIFGTGRVIKKGTKK